MSSSGRYFARSQSLFKRSEGRQADGDPLLADYPGSEPASVRSAFTIGWSVGQAIVAILNAPPFDNARGYIMISCGLLDGGLAGFDLFDQLTFEFGFEFSSGLSCSGHRFPGPIAGLKLLVLRLAFAPGRPSEQFIVAKLHAPPFDGALSRGLIRAVEGGEPGF